MIYLFRALFRFVKLILQNRFYARKNYSIVDIFRENVKKHPNKVALIFEGKEWTFQEVGFDYKIVLNTLL